MAKDKINHADNNTRHVRRKSDSRVVHKNLQHVKRHSLEVLDLGSSFNDVHRKSPRADLVDKVRYPKKMAFFHKASNDTPDIETAVTENNYK